MTALGDTSEAGTYLQLHLALCPTKSKESLPTTLPRKYITLVHS